MKKAAISSVISGGVLIVVGIALAVWGIAGLNSNTQAVMHGKSFSGTTSVTLQQGQEKSLWADSSSGAHGPCQLTRPDATVVTVSREGYDVSITRGPVTYTYVGTIQAQSTGSHQLVCGSRGSFSLTDPYRPSAVAEGVAKVVGGVVAGILGLLLILVGVLLAVLGRNKTQPRPAPGAPRPQPSGRPGPQPFGRPAPPPPGTRPPPPPASDTGSGHPRPYGDQPPS